MSTSLLATCQVDLLLDVLVPGSLDALITEVLAHASLVGGDCPAATAIASVEPTQLGSAQVTVDRSVGPQAHHRRGAAAGTGIEKDGQVPRPHLLTNSSVLPRDTSATLDVVPIRGHDASP